MGKVLFFIFPGEGHINPTIPLVEELIKQDEEVVYYCVEEYKTKIEKTGALVRPYENFLTPSHITKRVNEKIDPLEMLLYMGKAMDAIIEEVLKEVRGEKYDYVIYDNNFAAGWIIADVLNLPKISSCTTFAINQELFSTLMQIRGEMDKNSPKYQEIEEITTKWKDKYGVILTNKKNLMTCLGDITLVYTSKFYQPNAEEFDESFIFVGPSIAKRHDIERIPFKVQHDTKLIFISMGTVFNQQPELYTTCFEAFRKSPYTVILAVGKQTDIHQFDDIPSNFRVHQYVPQLEILEQADVFITHGGMNSSSEALYFGVPLVVIPVMGDQPIVSNQIEKLGAGLQLNRLNLDAPTLRNTTEQVLSNASFKDKSSLVGKSLREAGGYKKAVEVILKFKETTYI
ncbi:macrolide family glycosyltransferase [Priestia megaterium]|uniref:macrolide family glycosyltransferase n=1 Tax=Priestia megaterium TaxID=1404 RepID=UPI0013E37569|nr:macrolide family glycosyltransferase [Priestia megaterium]MED3867239.1 glycosyltransferase [Priestia megaterium]MED4146656.1 glycosyltransferase [Priestia megaterium]MED4170326.1 glycosyltransferase [Priestia megaterium]